MVEKVHECWRLGGGERKQSLFFEGWVDARFECWGISEEKVCECWGLGGRESLWVLEMWQVK